MKKISLILSFILMSKIFSLYAAENSILTPSAFSLEQALGLAYQNNPQMLEARKQISVSKAEWFQAEMPPNPFAEMDIGGLKKNEEGKRSPRFDQFWVKQPLDPLGVRFLRGRRAWDEVKISQGRVDLVWAKIREDVIAVYSNILALEKAVEVAQNNLEITRQFLSQVETRFQAGSALKSEVLRARIEASRAENEFLIHQKNLQVSKGELNLLLGREVQEEAILKGDLAYEPLHLEFKGLVERALLDRADLRNQKRTVSSSKKKVWMEWLRMIFPETAIGMQRITEEYENDTAIMVELSYPIWGFNLGKIKKAKAQKQIQEIRMDNLKRTIGLEVYQAFLEAELADKQVLLKKKSLEEANELLRMITLQYEEGELSFLNYLENIKTIKETRFDYLHALGRYQQKVAQLERVIQKTPIPDEENDDE